MPKYILKPNPDEDLFITFSTVVEQVVSWGTRQEYLNAGEALDRIQRAETTGTSAFGHFYGWNDPVKSVIYDQQGFLKIKDFPEVVRRYEEIGEEADLSDLIEPFDHDD